MIAQVFICSIDIPFFKGMPDFGGAYGHIMQNMLWYFFHSEITFSWYNFQQFIIPLPVFSKMMIIAYYYRMRMKL